MVNHEGLVLDAVFSALGDATRRGILERLARGPACARELAAPFAVTAPAISKHLRVLEKSGLIRRSIEGRVHWFRLNPAPMKRATDWIERQHRVWDGLLDSLEQLSMGSRTIFEMPRIVVMRGFILNHNVHHRAQLGVYLRMLGVPLPSIYGPSADEQA